MRLAGGADPDYNTNRRAEAFQHVCAGFLICSCARVAACVVLTCARVAACVMLTCARVASCVMPTCARVAALCMLARDLARVSMLTLYLSVIWKLTSGKSNHQYETV